MRSPLIASRPTARAGRKKPANPHLKARRRLRDPEKALIPFAESVETSAHKLRPGARTVHAESEGHAAALHERRYVERALILENRNIALATPPRQFVGFEKRHVGRPSAIAYRPAALVPSTSQIALWLFAKAAEFTLYLRQTLPPSLGVTVASRDADAHLAISLRPPELLDVTMLNRPFNSAKFPEPSHWSALATGAQAGGR